jgi:hypothetical protein
LNNQVIASLFAFLRGVKVEPIIKLKIMTHIKRLNILELPINGVQKENQLPRTSRAKKVHAKLRIINTKKKCEKIENPIIECSEFLKAR